jgi:hypothetical protein
MNRRSLGNGRAGPSPMQKGNDMTKVRTFATLREIASNMRALAKALAALEAEGFTVRESKSWTT